MDETLRQRIRDLVTGDDVVLFMKGTRHFPQCGFSSQVVGILNSLGPKYQTVNILTEGELREGMKEFSSWPTFPQLYVHGSFVGGCDIVREMHASGELQALLGAAPPAPPAPPAVAVTDAAAGAFRDALAEAGADVLRLEITPEFQYDLHVGPKAAGDVPVAIPFGLTLHVEASSARRADGMRIDFVTEADPNKSGGFKIENPNEPPRVRSLSVLDLRTWLDARSKGEKAFELIDVRTDAERSVAQIPGAKHLDGALEEELLAAERSKILVFHCHHGVRSRSAAEAFLREGFREVWNVEGGIDAWSERVDPSVRRYG
jgi:monothiol glutaredoxin